MSSQSSYRQPIVAVMGHVDHGKTTFLDSIRGANIADKEHGGITQNTRAHEVITPNKKQITFIDTPGHEAFSKMRERGAKVTDFVLLMVAADDGLQPQTKESIEFAKEHNVPIIVAINKIDLEGVQVEKVKQELSSFGVLIEEYGGDVMCFEISAKNNTGLNEVLEGIELMAEINELKPREFKEEEKVIGEAFVLESQKDKNIGYSVLCVLKGGNLKGMQFGVTVDGTFKARGYFDDEGNPIKEVHESQPFTVIGPKTDLPTGDIINFVINEVDGKNLFQKIESGEVSDEADIDDTKDLESLFAQMLVDREEKKQGVEQKLLNVILRTSTQGTLEAVEEQLKNLETEESKVKILQKGTGSVTEDDLEMAKIAKGIVLSFQVSVPNKIKTIAKKEKILVRKYEVIYDLVDEIADVLDSMDAPSEQEVEMGRAKILKIFELSDGSQVAGSQVSDGKFMKGYTVKIIRNSGKEEVEVDRAKIRNVKQNKEEVKQVKKGQECGLLLDHVVDDLQEGDEIVAFRVEKV